MKSFAGVLFFAICVLGSSAFASEQCDNVSKWQVFAICNIYQGDKITGHFDNKDIYISPCSYSFLGRDKTLDDGSGRILVENGKFTEARVDYSGSQSIPGGDNSIVLEIIQGNQVHAHAAISKISGPVSLEVSADGMRISCAPPVKK